MKSIPCISYKTSVVLLVVSSIISLIPSEIYSQQASSSRNYDNSKIKIDKTFNANTQIKLFSQNKPITSLAISCDIVLNSDTSLVRVILVDENQTEFLVCEIYSLVIDSNLISLSDYGEETVLLNSIIPNTLRVEITDASVYLKEVTTSNQEQYTHGIAVEKSQQQQSDKIKMINDNIIKKGGLWIAGETSISRMTYQEKKQLFGGSIPNLQGFEYYAGGIFVLPGYFENKTLSGNNSVQNKLYQQPSHVKEFSWRNRHGQDWVTPVKNQGGCGSCWAFAAAGAVELLVNIYFNQHIDLDLSEQDILSCSTAGSCAGGVPFGAFGYIMNTGVSNESCFPYTFQDEGCSNKCMNPEERIRIGGIEHYDIGSDDFIKHSIIKGPATMHVLSWYHVLTLVGYKVIEQGDFFYSRSGYVTIDPGHPLIGKTAWLLKNSWDYYWGDNGYLYLVGDLSDVIIDIPKPLITSLVYDTSDITCDDSDSDGYYNWGIGPKPLSCPSCPDLPDGDDSDPCKGYIDYFGNIHSITANPISNNITVRYGDPVPDLTANGEKILWYADIEGKTLIQTGNTLYTGLTDPGIYTYYVSQTVAGCESDNNPVTLTIIPEINAPVVENVTLYLNDPVPDILAVGDNIKWYSDPKNPLLDIRDGQIYNTTLIGNQLWMAENLNYGSTGSCYYNHDSINFAEKYGRLYTFDEALNTCPLNWHLASDEDWIELEMFLGMSFEEVYDENFRGTGIGSLLKEPVGINWREQMGEVKNEYGFTARPSGAGNCIDSFFDGSGIWAEFLTSTAFGPDKLIKRALDPGDRIRRDEFFRTGFYTAVRCLSYPSEAIFEGNSFKPGYTLPGKYTYYVTQTKLGFESIADTVVFTILSEIKPPEGISISVCEKSQIPDLYAVGENVKWYGDSLLINMLHTGNTFSPGQKEPGAYHYFITQTVSGCESEYSCISLFINPLPYIPLGGDTTILHNQDIYLGPFNNDNFYLWNDGSHDPYHAMMGNEAGIGNHAVSVIVTDASSCSFSDTININIVRCEVAHEVYEEACESYTSPSGNNIWTNTGAYLDTIQTADGCDSVITINLTIKTSNNSITQNGSILTANATGASYQWIDCNNGNSLIVGETDHTFTASADGNYAVIVSQNGCTDTSECLTIIVDGIEVNGFNYTITIYPNPNDGSFSIDLGKVFPKAEISISELDGRIIRNDKVFNSRFVDMQLSATPGIYVIIISSDNEKAVFKIMKK